MGFKEAITVWLNTFVYMIMLLGILLLLAQVYALAALCILGGWAIDRLYFKRWCLGFHFDHMEDASVQTLPVQKGEDRSYPARAQRAADLFFKPPWSFARFYLFRFGFLDGLAGFAAATLSSLYVFVKYLKLRELVRKEKSLP